MTIPRAHVLLVEDNPGDIFMVREALQNRKIPVDLTVAETGEKAFDWIACVDFDESMYCPDLVLLDLNLPLRDGREVLERVRKSPRCSSIPVVIISSSPSNRDRDDLIRLGANHFFTKSTDYDQYMLLGGVVQTLLESCGRTRE